MHFLPKGHNTKYALLYFGFAKLRGEGEEQRGWSLLKKAGPFFFAFSEGILKSHNTLQGGSKEAEFIKIGGANEFFAFSKDLQKVATKRKAL